MRDVLSAEECRASIDDLWNYLETRSYKLREWAGPTEYELEVWCIAGKSCCVSYRW